MLRNCSVKNTQAKKRNRKRDSKQYLDTRKKYYQKGYKPNSYANLKQRWSNEDLHFIMNSRQPDWIISFVIKRTITAIQVKRSKEKASKNGN